MSSIANKVLAMKDALDNQNDMDNAPAFIAGDKIHSWEILKNNPGTAKIAVGFESASARVNFPGGDITGRDNQTLYAIISRGRGLNSTRSDNLVYGSGGGKPLFELAETMRNKLRAMRFDPQTDEVTDYIGMTDWAQELNIPFGIDAFICRIWVGTQLPQPATSQQLPSLPI